MPAHICHNSPKKNRFIGAVQAGIPITKAAELHHIPKQTASDIWLKFKKNWLNTCPPLLWTSAKDYKSY